METLLPQLQIALSDAENPAALFPAKPREIHLEIGFGGGEHLAARAKQNPDIGFIGCEPFMNGIAGLLDHIDKEDLKNIRIFPDDARKLLDALPDAALARCFVLYPDPWPKARHEKRRFIGPENMPRFARVLKKGGELHIATDVQNLALWMIEHLDAAPEFARGYGPSDTPPPDWTRTRYEEKGIKAGRRPTYAIYRRK
jgi:tRNA (guanine-N7-)-methyltransferase